MSIRRTKMIADVVRTKMISAGIPERSEPLSLSLSLQSLVAHGGYFNSLVYFGLGREAMMS